MNEDIVKNIPASYTDIAKATIDHEFSMASNILACSLLRTLASSKSGSSLLELGTGTGLSTSWILDGMDKDSTLISIDHDASLLDIADKFLGMDSRLSLVKSDGGDWINSHGDLKFDFIFADTWHGKYLMLDEVLDMLLPGGLYIVDDMLPQPNWPEGHDEKADSLVQQLETRKDLTLTRLRWATGIIIAIKR